MAGKTKGITAQDIIDQVGDPSVPLPPDEAVQELRKLLDARDAGAPITREHGLMLLQSYGWRGKKCKFDLTVKRLFGRTWCRA